MGRRAGPAIEAPETAQRPTGARRGRIAGVPICGACACPGIAIEEPEPRSSDGLARDPTASLNTAADLPAVRPLFIMIVLEVDIGRYRVGQVRKARSPQIVQAPTAPLRAACCQSMNVA